MNNNTDLHNYLIERYINQTLTQRERNLIDEWSSENPKNRQFLEDISAIKDDIELLSLMESVDAKAALRSVKKRIGRKQLPLRVLGWWKNAAAILAIPLLALSAYLLSGNDLTKENVIWNEVESPFGLVTGIYLPDSSRVMLNGRSRLVYPSSFSGKERIVKLEGEAFFEVRSSKENPFIVECSDIKVRATGTEFNVSEYEDVVSVSLCRGKVDVSAIGDNRVSEVMEPGQTLFYHDGDIRISDRDIEKYIDWKDGRLVFADDNISDVFAKLERVYGVRFKLMGDIDRNYSYTGSFEKPSLERVLSYMEMTTPVKFRYTVSGTETLIEVYTTKNN